MIAYLSVCDNRDGSRAKPDNPGPDGVTVVYRVQGVVPAEGCIRGFREPSKTIVVRNEKNPYFEWKYDGERV